MSTLRQAAQQALEALVEINKLSIGEHAICLPGEIDTAMDALRKALAEPEKNPFGDDAERYARKLREERESYKAIFTAPTPQPEQEPVAWMYPHQLQEVKEYGRGGIGVRAYSGPSSPNLIPVYTAPTPRKPLTPIAHGSMLTLSEEKAYAAGWKAAERAHGIGGGE